MRKPWEGHFHTPVGSIPDCCKRRQPLLRFTQGWKGLMVLSCSCRASPTCLRLVPTTEVTGAFPGLLNRGYENPHQDADNPHGYEDFDDREA